MSNKMLIDASHPEETRVAVVRGNRVEEFDFESLEKKQLRGNIYLAKVTRVEPSLQAAFVDYGGNRHGFLAFSEIHPDYYQIPVADRQALLDAEAEEARAFREAEEAEENETEEIKNASVSDAVEEDDEPKKKPRRRRSRKAKVSDDSSSDTTDDEVKAEETSENTSQEDEKSSEEVIEVAEDNNGEEAQEEKPKPKRRTTRRKPAAKKATDDTSEENTENNTTPEMDVSVDEPSEQTAEDSQSSKDDDGSPTTMAAIVEMDSISEDIPDETDTSDDEPAATEETVEEKPKRRSTRRKPAAKKKTDEDEVTTKEEASDAVELESNSEQKEEETAESQDQKKPVDDEDGLAEKPKKRTPRKRKSSSRKKTEEADEKPSSDNDDETDGNDVEVEQVGQEDALEEVTNPRRQRKHYKIQEVIKRRQVLLVQVVKEERGNKGAALTTYLSLAGRYSVLMPNTARGGGISRKITNAADRKRLKSIASKLDVPQGMGVILRTAGASRTDVEINRDFEYLMRLWEQVRNLTLSSTAPCLVYEEGSLIKRSIRDLYDKDTGEILVCGENGFKEAKDFMGMLMPEHARKVKHYKESQTIFSKFGVEAQLERMVAPQVTMKSGGYLVINQTEALVAVDVNSGRSTREHSIEDTALQTNLEAAEEVARQLRLRDLAGLIVIDFIDMEEKRNNRAVEKRLKDCLKNDRARIQVGRISHFGLMEMSRQRMRSSVLESTMDVCEQCGGTGYIRSESAIALHVFRSIEEHVMRHNKFDAIVKTTRPIAFHILNHKRSALLQLEMKYGLQILVEGDATISGQDFTIEKGELAQGEPSQTVVGYQNEAAFDALNKDENDTDEKPNRKKRSRKRNKDQEETEVQQDLQSNENAENDEGEDGDRPRRKRRRGKRGGRRKNNASENNENEDISLNSNDGEAENIASDDQISSDTKNAEEMTNSEATAVISEDTNSSEGNDDMPKRRTSRRNHVTQKAPVQKKLENKEDTNASSEDTETKAEPPRPVRRRTTRRVASAETADVAEVNEDIKSDETNSKTAETNSENVAAENNVADTEKKSEKKGWWSRGGGFF